MVLRDVANARGDFDRMMEDDPHYLRRLRGHHRIVDANPAALRLLGVADLEDLSTKVGRLLPADPNGNVVRAIARGERTCKGERDLIDGHGTRTPILWQTTLPELAEDFSRVYFFAVDISEQKLAQEAHEVARAALNHAGRLSLVGELVASMTHEVSQPISSISLLAEASGRWLRLEPPNVGEARTFIDRITVSSNHAAQVVRRIRDFSRVSPTRYAPIAPLRLVSEALALVEPESRRQGVTIRMGSMPMIPCVLADDIQIKQVLVNIVVNAFQAIASNGNEGREGIVALDATLIGDFVEFSIVDNGPGIADVAQVLEPFFTTKPEGLGLGLSICKRIVEDHGGRLHIESDRAGTAVCFSLPGAGPGQQPQR